jgi:replicative DNA helicase
MSLDTSNQGPENCSQLPHSIEAEQALLGAILINDDALDRVENTLNKDDFFEPIHQYIYEVMLNVRGMGRRITPALLIAILNSESRKTDIAGLTMAQYLARLAAEATTVVNAIDYAHVVVEHADRRRMIASAETLAAAAKSCSSDPKVLATDFIEQLDGIASRNSADHVASVSVGRAAERSICRMQTAIANSGKLTGVTTGVSVLDDKLNGWQRGKLIVLAGRPGMGKSGAIISSVRQSAEQGVSVLLFSLEMSAEDITDRMLADSLYRSRDSIAYVDIARGRLSTRQEQAVIEARKAINRLSIKIDPQGGVTASQIATRARRHKQLLERHGRTLDLVIVDHLHIMRASNRYAGNRVAEVTEISGALKALAKELNVPVVAVSQLSRQVENRDDKRPTLADLRDSGSLEQDADVIAFLYREAYYLDQKFTDSNKDQDRVARLREVCRTLEIHVAKNRNGPTCRLELFFDVPSNALRSEAPYNFAKSAA